MATRIRAFVLCALSVWLIGPLDAASQNTPPALRGYIRPVADGPPVKRVPPDEHIDRVYEAKSLREAQTAERVRHQDAMEQVSAFQKRARERYNDDMKRCRDRELGNESECMRTAATRHRQASSESQRLHRREMDLYNYNLAFIHRVWAEPGAARDGNTQPPRQSEPRLDAHARSEARSWARAEAREAEAERRTLHERDQRDKQRSIEEQRAFERAVRQAQQP